MKSALIVLCALIATPFMPHPTRTQWEPAGPDRVAQVASMERQAAALSASMAGDITRYVRDVVSSAGAVGLMQIMPLHVREDHPCGTDLTDGITSVCYGSAILREYLGRALDRAIRESLNAYNGCVRTPGCETYATKVVNLTEE